MRNVVSGVRNFEETCFGLKEQIESAHLRRGGVIAIPAQRQQRRIKFRYYGSASPINNKRDHFHVGQFAPDLKLARSIAVTTSVMRECCRNVLFTPLQLSTEHIREGIAGLKRTKITRAEVREFIVPHLPCPHHRSVVQDLDGDLFEVVDVLTAIGRAEPASYFLLGLFAGLVLTSAVRTASSHYFDPSTFSEFKVRRKLQ